MTYEQAYELAKAWVRICCGNGVEVVFDATIEKPYGWVFFYNSKEWIETPGAKGRRYSGDPC
jgi:hypothetical protein